MNTVSTEHNAIVSILRAADNRGLRLRRWKQSDERHEAQREYERSLIAYACNQLDAAGVEFYKQNAALHWYNNAEDRQAWEAFKGLNEWSEAEHILTITL